MTADMNTNIGLCHSLRRMHGMPHCQPVGMTLPAMPVYDAAVAGSKAIQICNILGFGTDIKGPAVSRMESHSSMRTSAKYTEPDTRIIEMVHWESISPK